MSDIRIGDEVYIHGFVDEVRKDVVIIKNEGGYFGTVADEIMPSAQPEYRLDEWCTDCKEYDTERHCCPRFNQVIRTTLDEMKSERKMGKWIYNSPVTMKCDQCGFVIKDWDWHRFKFCPNCDCDMRGEQE